MQAHLKQSGWVKRSLMLKSLNDSKISTLSRTISTYKRYLSILVQFYFSRNPFQFHTRKFRTPQVDTRHQVCIRLTREINKKPKRHSDNAVR